jgi:xanthine dehydrogenase YagR molybdenum-binding subunit
MALITPTTKPSVTISTVGKPLDRTDGRLKVTGAAMYAADAPVAAMTYAVLVPATIARGRIRSIDESAAKKAPGVIAIITHRNAAKLNAAKEDFEGNGGVPAEQRLPLADDAISYAGQGVALVVAETLAQAQHAAELIHVEYAAEPPLLDRAAAEKDAILPPQWFGEDLQHKRGDVAKALADPAAIKIEATYITPIETHNPMELCATVAAWNGDKLTVHDATQWVMGTRAVLATAFGVPRESVRVICPFVGGAFGCKGFQWPHSIAAALAAKQVGRPVKLYLSRKQMFTCTGHRPRTIQRLALAATKDGKLTAIRHETVQETSFVGEHIEACGLATSRFLYACDNVEVPHKLIKLNIATPTPMRAPGECPGSFALESAMDELAIALKIDPVELRVHNHADVHGASGLPWSSKYLKECYQIAAESFGWSKRNPAPRSMRDAYGRLIGWGMATATYPGYVFPASAKVRLTSDGRALVSSATHDLGTGAWTVFTQVAADALGLPLDRVKFELGDTVLPPAPVAGGSNSTASVSQAILVAAASLRTKLLALAARDPASPLAGLSADNVIFTNGTLADASNPRHGVDLRELIQHARVPAVEAEGSSAPGDEQTKFAFQSHGCHFIEVTIDEPLARVRVTRVVSAIDNGRVINRKTARSQVVGGVVMGIGMALLEATEYDQRSGRPVNDSLADYPVCTNADIGSIDVHLIDVPDPHINTLGCRGIGEIAIVGVAAAVANAVYHATGKRIRELPITPDKLL